jgi:hypothetical protein
MALSHARQRASEKSLIVTAARAKACAAYKRGGANGAPKAAAWQTSLNAIVWQLIALAAARPRLLSLPRRSLSRRAWLALPRGAAHRYEQEAESVAKAATAKISAMAANESVICEN